MNLRALPVVNHCMTLNTHVPGFQEEVKPRHTEERNPIREPVEHRHSPLRDVMGNSVTGINLKRGPFPKALGSPDIKVLWAESLWSISHTTLDLWFIENKL